MQITDLIDSMNKSDIKYLLEEYNKDKCQDCERKPNIYLAIVKSSEEIYCSRVLCTKHIKAFYSNKSLKFKKLTFQDIFYMQIVLDKV